MKKCPNCNVIMNEVLKIDVTIDVCPSCMGIWLDKGELEKIVERAKQTETQYSNYDNDKKYNKHHDDDDHDEHYYDDRDKHGFNNGYPRKKRGGIGEIFGNLFD